MEIYCKEACCFMHLVSRFMADDSNYLLHINDVEGIDPDKTLLGYYDDKHIYLIPSVVAGMCDTILIRNNIWCFNFQNALRQLSMLGIIVTDISPKGEVRYRHKMQTGNKRKRYITLIRKSIPEGLLKTYTT